MCYHGLFLPGPRDPLIRSLTRHVGSGRSLPVSGRAEGSSSRRHTRALPARRQTPHSTRHTSRVLLAGGVLAGPEHSGVVLSGGAMLHHDDSSCRFVKPWRRGTRFRDANEEEGPDR